MAIFDNFPYTNFHELNADWIIGVVKNVDQSQKDIDSKIQAETDRATAKENEIDTKLNHFTQQQLQENTAINERIVSETARAQNEEEKLLKRIGTEQSRATAAETANADAITEETNQRIVQDSALQKTIGANGSKINIVNTHLDTLFCGLDVVNIDVTDVDYIKMQAGKTVKLNVASLPSVQAYIKAPTEEVTEIKEARLIIDLYNSGKDNGVRFGIEGFTRTSVKGANYTQPNNTYVIYNARYIPGEGWVLYRIDSMYHV
jgi:hypothetical protein